MLKSFLNIICLCFVIVGCKHNKESLVVNNPENASYINPFICTASDHGQTDVAAGVPFGMVKPCPDTKPIAHSGYDYDAKEIVGFSNTRFSGVGCRGVGGNIRILPFSVSENDTLPKSLSYSKESEKALAGYYAVTLNNGVKAELTASRQVAYHKYTFPESKHSGLSIDLSSSFSGHISEAHNILEKGVISGKITTVNICGNGQYSLYYAIQIDKDIKAIVDKDSKMIFKFSTQQNEEVLLKCALSVVDENSAINNLKHSEGKLFSEVKENAFNKWNDLMQVVNVETENDTLKELFYTHLYHATQSPFVINDNNGTFRGSDGKQYKTDKRYYHGWSIWDTFRSKLPLFSLFYPEQYSEMMESLRLLYKQGKADWTTNTEPFLTIRTEHAIVMLLEAYKKGVLPFSLANVYTELKKEAEHLPFKSPDNVLESSFDLWALSEIATILGHHEDAKQYKDMAFEYKAIWKDKFLNMDENSDVMHGDGLYEGTLWQYRWFVPFDIKGIQDLVGGKDTFEKQLDYFFDNELFNMGNQPDIQVPYLYAYTNAPWKTQKLVDKLLNKKTNNWYGTHKKFERPVVKKIFTATPEGYIKEMDDDAGTMSSWYVWSTMGLYPVFPGSTQLALTTPQFDKITIETSDKPLQIIANGLSSDNIFIQSVTWNGEVINESIIDFNLISKGGKLQFELDNMPNTNWGKQN
ncbi:GH92 family glycosyl hydrolase [uncultured Algibacter sp.]|uniref:GH92 family glycosyl hydrolase n=1 Tax=uncultured Algibacter sp. TaxID=298659 RepID=UPI00260E7218|nr:GH92 family glycosyl hydrolase [uncultured Algibacter sp.]